MAYLELKNVSKNFGETGDAFGLVAVGFGKARDLALQRVQQLQQFALAILRDAVRALNPRFDLADGILDHTGLTFEIVFTSIDHSLVEGFIANYSFSIWHCTLQRRGAQSDPGVTQCVPQFAICNAK